MTSKQSSRRLPPTAARGLKIAVVVSRYNETVSARLLRGARSCLKRHGARSGDVEVFFCPGAFELPQVAGRLARDRSWDAVICLGAVIRGETAHFEYVAAEAARGIQSVALNYGLPVTFGVLTTDTKQQAMERSGGKRGNKGSEAAFAALEMIRLFRSIKRFRM
jgi:6,7-dimethyl-8-ribityllumazine synthase